MTFAGASATGLAVIVTTKLCSSKHAGVPEYTYTVCEAVSAVPTAIGPTPFGELKYEPTFNVGNV